MRRTKFKEGDRVMFIGTDITTNDVPNGVKGTVIEVRENRFDLDWDSGIVGNNRSGHSWVQNEFKLLPKTWKEKYAR